jgi:hypothetical protein
MPTKPWTRVSSQQNMSPVTSTSDFLGLTQLVLAAALERAGTWVCEPLADLTLAGRRPW